MKAAKSTRRNSAAADSDAGKPAPDRPERRKMARRVAADRRDHMRWELDSPIRRKNPGRRALDRLFYLLTTKR